MHLALAIWKVNNALAVARDSLHSSVRKFRVLLATHPHALDGAVREPDLLSVQFKTGGRERGSRQKMR